MQILMLIVLTLWWGMDMRRIALLRHAGQARGARRLYGRCVLTLSTLAWGSMAGQLTLLACNGLLSWRTALPLHLCSLMGVLLYPALRCGSRRLWQAVTYLAPLSGMGALLFPSVIDCAQPRLMRVCFFLLHCVLVIAPWTPLALGWRPTPQGAGYAAALLVTLALVDVPINRFTGGNYLFLNQPVTGTPLAWLGGGSIGRYWALLALMAGVVLGLEAVLAAWALKRFPPPWQITLDRFEIDWFRHLG